MTSSYWEEGEAYHRTAIGAKKRPAVFTPEIVYNLLAMAIEKYFMAFFDNHNTLPDNHTFSDLIHSANAIVPVPEDIVSDLRSLEIMQDICPVFEDYQRREPDQAQLDKMYNVTQRVADYCRRH